MTLPITSIINVTITRQTVFPQGPGFGTMLIVGTDAVSPISLGERIRFYNSLAELVVDFGSSTEEHKAAEVYFAQNPTPTRLAVAVYDNTTTPSNFAAELDLIVAQSDDWYAFIVVAVGRVSDDANIPSEFAAWAEGKNKLFVTASNEAAAIAAGGGLPGIFNGLGYDRSAVFYHQDADVDAANSYPEASFLGSMLTVDFDGVATTKTGKFKKLPGITVSPLTSAELAFLVANEGNAYVDVVGTNMVQNGTMSSAEFFDTMHGVDWLQSEIGFRVFGKLATLPKVPYTDQGMQILVGEVRLALTQAVKNGLVAADFDDDGNLRDAFSVTVPSVLSVSEANRSARIAPPISFTARLAGAVHSAVVNGIVTI